MKSLDDYVDDVLADKASIAPSSGSALTVNNKQVKGTQQWVDPDTIKVNNKAYRIEGYNAPEVGHRYEGIFIPPQEQGVAPQIPKILNQAGFTDIQPTGKSSYNREVAKVINPSTGESAGNFLTKIGAVEPNRFTDDESAAQYYNMQTVLKAFPERAKKDPILAGIVKENERRDKEFAEAGRRQYVPKVNAFNEEQYAAYKNSTGIKGINNARDTIKKIDAILASEGKPEMVPDFNAVGFEGAMSYTTNGGQQIPPEIKAKLLKQKEAAQQQMFYASYLPDIVGGVQFRHDDRTIMNQAYNQQGTVLYSALKDISKGFWGNVEMVGEKTGWDELKDNAKAHVNGIKMTQADLPATLSSFRDINTDSGWWNTAKDTLTYTGNLFAGTLPQMIITMGAAYASGGSSLGLALSTVPGSFLYTGQFYADQPDDKKNVPLAIAAGVGSGTLDRIGLDFLSGKLGANLFTITGKEEVINAMIQNGKAATRVEAEKILQEATKQEILAFTGFGKEFATRQLLSMEGAAKATGRATIAAGGEGGTELLQQELQMLGQSGQFNRNYKYNLDYKDQLEDAFVGGAVMGAGFHGARGVTDMAGWHSAVDAQRLYDKAVGDSQAFQADNQERLATQNGGHVDITQLARQTAVQPSNHPDTSLTNLPTNKGWFEGIKQTISDPLSLWRQLSHTAIPSITDSNGNFKYNSAYLKAIMGGFGILPGDSASVFQQKLMGKWSDGGAYDLASKLTGIMGFGVNKQSVNEMVKEAYNNYWSQGLQLPLNTEQNVILQNWKEKLDNTRKSMAQSAIDAGLPFNHLLDENALFQSSRIDVPKLNNNKPLIVNEMVNSGATRSEATTAVNNLNSSNRTKASAAVDYLSQYGFFTNPNLQHIFHSNILDSIEHMKERTAHQVMHATYLGKDGNILGKLLLAAKDAGEFNDSNGVFDEKAFKAATTEVRAWYDITNNDYNNIESPFISSLQNYLVTAALLSSLSKAAISSQAEATLASLGTPAKLLGKQFSTYAQEYATEYATDMAKGASFAASLFGIKHLRQIPDVSLQERLDELNSKLNAPNASQASLDAIQKEIDNLHERYYNRKTFSRLGFHEAGFDASNKYDFGGTDTNKLRKIMGVFVSAISLRAQTDANRMAVLSVAGDIMMTQLNTLSGVDPAIRDVAFATGQGLTVEQQQALIQLQQYGLNVPHMLNAIDVMGSQFNMSPFEGGFLNTEQNAPIYEAIQDNIYTALINFVDSRIVNPQPFNTPKIYNDPRFKMVTTMQKFMGTATAVLLPRLYKQHILNGSVGMRYDAFATMGMTLIMSAFVNMFKDQLSYGEDSPYVKSRAKKAQRILNSSGLIGQAEKITEAISPTIEFSSAKFTEKPLEWAVDKAKGASPVVSWVAKPIEGAYNIAEGKEMKGAKKIMRAMPVIGSFPVVSNYTAEELVNAFKGK